MLATRLGDKGPTPCRAGPPELTGSLSWAQRAVGRVVLSGASPARACPGQGPRGDRPSWCPGGSGGARAGCPVAALHPCTPVPLHPCSQVECVPEGCPGSCLQAPAVTFPGAPCPASCPFSWERPAPWDPRAVGAPQALSRPPGPAVREGRGSFFRPPPRAVLQGPLCRKTSCFHPGLRNKLCVFGNRRVCLGSGCVWQAVGSGWFSSGARPGGKPAGPRAHSPPVCFGLPVLGHQRQRG